MTLVIDAARGLRPQSADLASLRLKQIVRATIASLHAELVLSPKPGLVCPDDRGSHADMDARTMMRSIVALRHGFAAIARAAADGASFARLQALGIDAEHAMLHATGGVNTHRGAIFHVRLLVAAAARCGLRRGQSESWSRPSRAPHGSSHRESHATPLSIANLRDTIRTAWGAGIARALPALETHGFAMAVRHGAGGARREAADAFPTVFETLLPVLREARRRGLDARRARIAVLMTSIATTTDTNLLYRGGAEGLAFAQRAARAFLDRGGVGVADWEAALREIGRAFVIRNLSPGGSADLLAATILVDRLVEAR